MCGIFGYIGNEDNAPEIVLEGLKRLEYRGYDSWGLAYAKHKLKAQNLELKIIKNVGKIGEAKIGEKRSTMALGHTRWATHGGVTKENAHPHTDCKGTVSVVHNGIIENFQQLREKLIKKGHKFKSETDTEIIAHLVEEYLKSGLDSIKAVRESFIQLEGRNAIVVFIPEDEILITVKNGSPLILGKESKGSYIASDAASLIPRTKKIIFLEDNLIGVLRKDSVRLYQLETEKTIKTTWQNLDWEQEQAEKGSYDYFYLKEVMQQANTLAETINQNDKTVRSFAKAIRGSYGTYFIGAGSAYYACLTGSYIFSKIARRHINVLPASEFPYTQHFIRPDSLVVGVSQSGETADLLEAIESARENKANIGAVVNIIGSSLYRTADYILPLRVGPEKAVLATKSFTSMLAVFYLLAYTLIGEYKRGRETMLSLVSKVEKYLLKDRNLTQIENIADRLQSKRHIFTLGRGLNYPIALEAALKIKESSYIHAEGFAGGELKHGVIALVEKDTPFVAFVPNDETRKDIISNIMEVKARGAYVIGISPERNGIFDDWIRVPDVGATSPIVSIIPVQLLAYYLTIKRGLDPDKPRNLAKSVTVK